MTCNLLKIFLDRKKGSPSLYMINKQQHKLRHNNYQSITLQMYYNLTSTTTHHTTPHLPPPPHHPAPQNTTPASTTSPSTTHTWLHYLCCWWWVSGRGTQVSCHHVREQSRWGWQLGNHCPQPSVSRASLAPLHQHTVVRVKGNKSTHYISKMKHTHTHTNSRKCWIYGDMETRHYEPHSNHV